MAETWTDPDNVIADWIGDGAPTDLEQVARWVAKAERLIRYHVPSITERLEAEKVAGKTDLLEEVRDVVTSVVHRVFRNPEGIRQRNETTGPFTGSVTFGGDIPGGLALTAKEIDQLRGQESSPQRAYGISMIPHTSPFYPRGAVG